MIDPRLASFAMGATFGMVLRGWPWHPRFSRYSRPAPRWQTLPPPPAPGMHRVYINSPATMAECGGPCCQAMDPRACTCGELWVDVPLPPEMDPCFGEPWDGPIPPLAQRGTPPPPPSRKPNPSGGRLIRGDRRPDPTYRPDWSPCSQPPNDPSSQP